MEREDWRERVRLISETADELADEASEPDTCIGPRAALANYFAGTLQTELRKIRESQ